MTTPGSFHGMRNHPGRLARRPEGPQADIGLAVVPRQVAKVDPVEQGDVFQVEFVHEPAGQRRLPARADDREMDRPLAEQAP